WQRRSNERIALAAYNYSLLPGCNASRLQLAFLMRGLNLAGTWAGVQQRQN
ncbi:unnamed protein product, partial [Urochloa humidicola]